MVPGGDKPGTMEGMTTTYLWIAIAVIVLILLAIVLLLIGGILRVIDIRKEL